MVGVLLGAAVGAVACVGASHPGDTTGVQTFGRWEWHAHLAVSEDSGFTLARIAIDTTMGGGDVMLLRYEFNPGQTMSGTYALTLGLDLGRVRELRPGILYPLGPPPRRIPTYATLTCLCPPFRPDSVRGTLQLVTRGMRQLTGHLDAAVYLTEWNDTTRHATYAVRQRFDAVK